MLVRQISGHFTCIPLLSTTSFHSGMGPEGGSEEDPIIIIMAPGKDADFLSLLNGSSSLISTINWVVSDCMSLCGHIIMCCVLC